jgi:SMC interacting uncharacterized protein involved in chromosome segregation
MYRALCSVILHTISGATTMTATTLRASYTISAPILQRFNAVVPHGERSRVMEALMKQALATREAELENIATAFMTDPAFAQCRDDETRWDATAGDGLENL